MLFKPVTIDGFLFVYCDNYVALNIDEYSKDYTNGAFEYNSSVTV